MGNTKDRSNANQGPVLVVGASSGIGLETIRRLREQDTEVYAISRTAPDEFMQLGVKHLAFDVTGDEMASVKAFLPERLSGLVYGPGTITLKPFQGLKIEDYRLDLEINLLGGVKILQVSLPALRKGAPASVVFFSTVASGVGMSYHASIAAAKSAVEGFALSTAAELARSNIRVNVVAPSLTDTRLAENLLSTDQKRESSADRHPLKRYGQPEDIARTVVFLLNEASGWLTGQIIGVDGGLSRLRPL
ncbi:SDR family oxidoreductase [candidate division GN15 bacterium]|nr:SDR family oxidoreductase [candidate division GN15 bacterium]